MRHAALLVAGSAGLLLLAALWPRAGHPVLLVLPAGQGAAAFAAEGWRIRDESSLGTLRLLHAMPDSAASDPWLLRAVAGAAAVLAARPGTGCAPDLETR